MRPSHYFLYELYKKNAYVKKKYINNKRWWKLELKYNHTDDVRFVEYKIVFNEKFSKYINRDWLSLRDASKSDLYDFISKHKYFMMKSNNGEKGHGVYKVLINSDEECKEFICNNLGKDALVEEIITQHEQMSEFHENSLNTIRVSTLLVNNQVHIVCACIRIGVGDMEIDNFHAGGIAANIDIDKGIVISKGYTITPIQGKNFFVHPDSGKPIFGFQVPHWKKILDTVKETALLVPTLGWLGWDIAITKEGISIVEANISQAEAVLQLGFDAGIYDKIKQLDSSL